MYVYIYISWCARDAAISVIYLCIDRLYTDGGGPEWYTMTITIRWLYMAEDDTYALSTEEWQIRWFTPDDSGRYAGSLSTSYFQDFSCCQCVNFDLPPIFGTEPRPTRIRTPAGDEVVGISNPVRVPSSSSKNTPWSSKNMPWSSKDTLGVPKQALGVPKHP